ncbi:MAG TPA: hypothetical protein DCG34_04435 [Clostridiales bacterium]|nr:hypothetical protein [Clostridiales bacterium]
MRFALGIVGRIIFLIAFGLFITFFLTRILGNESKNFFDVDISIYILTSMLILGLFGFLTSFKSPRFGGSIVALSGVFNGVFLLFQGGPLSTTAAAVYGGPFVMAGVLIYLSYARKKRFY